MLIKRGKFLFVAGLIVLSFYMGIVITRAQQNNKGMFENLRLFSQILSLVKNQYVEEVDTEKLIHGAIKGMLSSLDDPHTHFMEPPEYKNLQVDTQGAFGGLGIEIALEPLTKQLIVVAPIEGTPADKAGIQAGDKIIEIEGESTRDITLQDAVKKLRGPKGTKVTITIKRDEGEKPINVTIVRDIIKLNAVKSRVMLEDKIGYLRIVTFNQNVARELREALSSLEREGMQGLIVDLRNNPGGLLEQAIEVSNEFVSEGVIVSTKGRVHKEVKYFAREEGTYSNFPLVILVNKGSASASEIVAGAIKDNKRGLILGTQTFGKGSVQTVLNLDDGSGLAITTAHYYTPSGICIQDTGIAPDIRVDDLIMEDIEEAKMINIMARNNCFTVFAKRKQKDEKEVNAATFKLKDRDRELLLGTLKDKDINSYTEADINKYSSNIEKQIKVALAELKSHEEGLRMSLSFDPMVKRTIDLMKGAKLLNVAVYDTAVK